MTLKNIMVDVAAHSLPEEVLFKMSKGFGNAHVPPQGCRVELFQEQRDERVVEWQPYLTLVEYQVTLN